MDQQVFAKGTKVPSIEIDHATSQAHYRQHQSLIELDNFGVSMLSIKDAAELISCELWCSGEIEAEELDEDFDGDIFDPRVKTALAQVTELFIGRLSNAIEHNKLKACRIRRDFDETLIEDETFVRFEDLEEWLAERGFSFGDAFAEWIEREGEIASQLVDELLWMRSVQKRSVSPGLFVGLVGSQSLVDESNNVELLAAYKSATLENKHLRERLAQAELKQQYKEDAPASPRSRQTLLVLIASVCLKAGIDIGRRGAAQRIMELTEEIGAPIDDETIRKILVDIPNALESRMR